MGGGKETPRQKMIGMMYLVLTALLAMNVSKQVLKGYVTVNESIERSRKNLDDNNKRVTEAFQQAIGGNPGSPTPLGASWFWMICTSVFGISLILSTLY